MRLDADSHFVDTRNLRRDVARDISARRRNSYVGERYA
jgi:hypothetical protein